MMQLLITTFNPVTTVLPRPTEPNILDVNAILDVLGKLGNVYSAIHTFS